jgi:hypothetical protein
MTGCGRLRQLPAVGGMTAIARCRRYPRRAQRSQAGDLGALNRARRTPFKVPGTPFLQPAPRAGNGVRGPRSPNQTLPGMVFHLEPIPELA